MRVIIFVNGEFSDPNPIRKLLQPDDYIMAVNGGTRHALRVGVTPQMVIGDLDSLPPNIQEQLIRSQTQIMRFPVRKDETDLELALRQAVALGATEIVLVATLGGRLDQSVANLCLLTLPMLKGITVTIREGRQTAFLIRDQAQITGQPGDTVSILPIGGDAIGVSNTGLEWPLHDETLPLGSTRGISNILREKQASINIRAGLLFCIVTPMEKPDF
jgi:thiamine pyrophosphokinase